MTSNSNNATSSAPQRPCRDRINRIISECLESIKLANIESYREAIVLRHDLFVKPFTEDAFAAWHEAHTTAIRERNRDRLAPPGYARILGMLWEWLPLSSRDKIWQFLDGSEDSEEGDDESDDGDEDSSDAGNSFTSATAGAAAVTPTPAEQHNHRRGKRRRRSRGKKF